MSESTNCMFEESRNGSWLHSIDTMLSTVMKRIVGMREELNKLTTQQKILEGNAPYCKTWRIFWKKDGMAVQVLKCTSYRKVGSITLLFVRIHLHRKRQKIHHWLEASNVWVWAMARTWVSMHRRNGVLPSSAKNVASWRINRTCWSSIYLPEFVGLAKGEYPYGVHGYDRCRWIHFTTAAID